MNREFWLERWRKGQIGWHNDRVMPLLEKHWSAVALPPRGARVLVPLAGKSLDMVWLAAQGFRVLGVELSLIAVEQFFAENHLEPVARDAPHGRHFTAGNIEVVCGDVMALDTLELGSCSGLYDRAALIALPPQMRRQYADRVYARLPRGCRGLMITLEYAQDQRDGPPFSVEEGEVRELLEADWDVSLLERRNVLAAEPRFAAQGVTALHTAIYRLQHRA